jgi:hypothetical protein
MSKSTISMAIFNSYVKSPEGMDEYGTMSHVWLEWMVPKQTWFKHQTYWNFISKLLDLANKNMGFTEEFEISTLTMGHDISKF